MNIVMKDGSECSIFEIGIVDCDAKDTAGRHFSGYAEFTIDLSKDTRVKEEYCRLWSSGGCWDGDWGLDKDSCEDFTIVRDVVLVDKQFEYDPFEEPDINALTDFNMKKGKMYRLLIEEV